MPTKRDQYQGVAKISTLLQSPVNDPSLPPSHSMLPSHQTGAPTIRCPGHNQRCTSIHSSERSITPSWCSLIPVAILQTAPSWLAI